MNYYDFPKNVFELVPENCDTVVYRDPNRLYYTRGWGWRGYTRSIKHSEVRPVVSIDGLQVLAFDGGREPEVLSRAWWLNEEHTLLAVGSTWTAERNGAWVWYFEWRENMRLPDKTTAGMWCRRTMMWKKLSILVDTAKVMKKLQQVGGMLNGTA